MEIMNLIWGAEADTYSSFEANISFPVLTWHID